MTGPAIELGSVGRDDGRLVVRFERQLDLPREEVRRVLASTRQRWLPFTGTRDERWEVDALGAGSLLTLVSWIAGEDVELAAATGADRHQCFGRVARHITGGEPGPEVTFGALVESYRAAVVAALADAD